MGANAPEPEDAAVWSERFDGIPATARCFDGHFPGAPITPGALLLGYAAAALRRRGLRMAAVGRMKFLTPLAPETGFEIVVTPDLKALKASILWRTHDAVVAQARIALARGED